MEDQILPPQVIDYNLSHPLVGTLFSTISDRPYGEIEDSVLAIKIRTDEFDTQRRLTEPIHHLILSGSFAEIANTSLSLDCKGESRLSQVKTSSGEISLDKPPKPHRLQTNCSNSCERPISKVYNHLRNKLIPAPQKKIEKSCIVDFHSEGQDNTSHTSSSKNKLEMRSYMSGNRLRGVNHNSTIKGAGLQGDLELGKSPLNNMYMSHVVTQLVLGDNPDTHIEYIRSLEAIIANLKNDLNEKSKENETLKKENKSLRKIISKVDKSKLHELKTKLQKEEEPPVQVEQNEEELDSFILAEKTAVDAMARNPLQNPIREILSLKTKVSSVDRNNSESKRSRLRMPLTAGSKQDSDLSETN